METYIPILVVFVAALVAGLVIRALAKRKGKYDERQIAAQGTAYKVAYFTLLIYMVVYGCVMLFLGTERFFVWAAIWGGVVLSITVFAIICIVRDAYFRSVDSPVVSIVLFLVLGAMDAYMGLRGVLWGDGDGGDWAITFAGAAFVVIGLVALIKRGVDRKQSDEES